MPKPKDYAGLRRHIAETFHDLSPQLQEAARHVLDRPDDVALKSMRKLAADARVHPSTMVRLARTLEFASYSAFRETFQHHLRTHPPGYLARARDLQARGADGDASTLIAETAAVQAGNLNQSMGDNAPAVFAAAAKALSAARRLYIVGHRGCYPVAFFFFYAHRMFGRDGVLLDGGGGTFADSLREVRPGDVILAISIEPYAHETVRAVEYARRRGAGAVTITDSTVSPLARNAEHVLLVQKETPSFFHSIVPAMAVAEALIVLMVAQGGDTALRAIADSERQLEEFEAYWQGDKARGRGSPA